MRTKLSFLRRKPDEPGQSWFRLWINFTVVWVIFWSAIFVDDFIFLKENPTFEVEGTFKKKHEITTPLDVSETDIVALLKKYHQNDCAESKNGPLCGAPAVLQMPAGPLHLTAMYIALAVPAGVLLFGALYRALTGFPRTR